MSFFALVVFSNLDRIQNTHHLYYVNFMLEPNANIITLASGEECEGNAIWVCLSVCMRNSKNIASIDNFRGACAVKGNVRVAGRTSRVSTTEMLSTHDVTLRNIDGSLFCIKI